MDVTCSPGLLCDQCLHVACQAAQARSAVLSRPVRAGFRDALVAVCPRVLNRHGETRASPRHAISRPSRRVGIAPPPWPRQRMASRQRPRFRRRDGSNAFRALLSQATGPLRCPPSQTKCESQGAWGSCPSGEVREGSRPRRPCRVGPGHEYFDCRPRLCPHSL
jgi:hypothetical protein